MDYFIGIYICKVEILDFEDQNWKILKNRYSHFAERSILSFGVFRLHFDSKLYSSAVEMVITKARCVFRLPDLFWRIIEWNYNQ